MGKLQVANSGSRSMMRSLAMFVLLLEAFVIFFATLLANSLPETSSGFVLGAGIFLFFLFFVGIAMLRKTWGYVFGSILQLLLLSSGFVVFSMFFVGFLFVSCWVYALFLGNKIDVQVRLVDKAKGFIS